MFEYGVLLDGTLPELLESSMTGVVRFLGDISPAWYLAGGLLLWVFIRLLTGKSLRR